MRKDEIELRVEEIVASFLAEPEMLASLAVDLADHYKRTHGRGDEILKELEARRTDVQVKLANFVKAISQSIFNASTAEAMNALEAQKQKLDAAIQAEHVKVALHEDETSIGAFYQRFAKAGMDEPEVRDLLLEHFIDKVWGARDDLAGLPLLRQHRADDPQRLHRGKTVGGTANLRSKARVRQFPLKWRWGESNPRPTADPEVFSGRILLIISQPPTSCRPAAGWAQSIERRSGPTDMARTQWPPERRQTPG